MLIIFEGPDGCGKTTIGKLVSHELGIPIYRQPRPDIQGEANWHDIYKDRQLNFVALQSIVPMDLILDRWHVSEMVYARFANTMRGATRIVDPVFDMSIAEAYKDAILVNVRCSYKVICRRVLPRDRKPYDFTEEEFNFIQNDFNEAAEVLPFRHVITLFTDSDATPEDHAFVIAQTVRLEMAKKMNPTKEGITT